MRAFISLVFLTALVAACASSVSVEQTQPAPADGSVGVPANLVTYPRFDDADPWDWDGRAPTDYAVHGIDISRWQGDINWPKAKRSGVNFVYMKATEGGDVLDPKFDRHRRAAESAGIPWGAYHYYYFCRSPEEQARWFIRHVPKGAPLPHVLDMEWNPRSRTCSRRPDERTVWQEARTFLNMLEAHYGTRPMLYTTVDFWQDTNIGAISRTEFWLRSTAGHPVTVYPGAYWTFWQYSGTGLVPGIEGEVDLNVFRGSPAAWVAWLVAHGAGAS